MTGALLDLLVVGAGPTGIALGAEARRAGLDCLLVERGALVESLVQYPTDMVFFTTRERLEIAGIPFPLPEEKPGRRQAIAYYQGVARAFGLSLALHEAVEAIRPRAGGFEVLSRGRSGAVTRGARAVAVATGYFGNPLRLGVPGEDRPEVRQRYREPWEHFGEEVVVIGGGNSGAEAALELFRHGARVTLVHRGAALKPTVKYWLRPDLENRIEEGSIRALFEAEVLAFEDGAVRVRQGGREQRVAASAVYVLIGYEPDIRLLVEAGVSVDPITRIPAFDAETGETDVPGLYVAGTVQAGRETHRIFIENSREHGPRIVHHLAARLGPPRGAPEPAARR
ncbi:MAG: YpdA family putative bacillithiol disulfide reductase [Thermoanaerobaculia bacterium]|nr:MAG: YpdA family putative bacillithiol disulfide reductase [Thermoanaerobaculia bacterium]